MRKKYEKLRVLPIAADPEEGIMVASLTNDKIKSKSVTVDTMDTAEESFLDIDFII